MLRNACQYQTLVELLRVRVSDAPSKHAYTYLRDGETDALTWDYGELDRRARAIGAWLQSCGAAGERALLLYPPGLDYLAAFFGCLYAGVVAVPAYLPQRQRGWPRVRAMLGAIGQELKYAKDLLQQLRTGLNPYSRFEFGKLSTLWYAQEWQAK